MRSIYIAANETKTLENQLAKLETDSHVKSVLFLMADEAHLTNELLSPLLTNIKKPLIGGVFPELIFEGERKNSGVLLLPLTFELKTQVFDLDGSSEEFFTQLERVQVDSMNPSSTLFVFTDALSLNKNIFIETLFNFFGVNPSYIGGGAGSLRFEPFPCIISNQGMHTNAAVIGWANKNITLGVAHGWHSISEALKVTEANKNQLESINWKPAFEVYKEIVEAHSGMRFNSENFYDIAKSYPLGIEKMGAESVVRDPFMVTNNTIHFVDNITEGEYVKVLHGDMASLLEGASKAKERALSQLEEGMDGEASFCIDCISRVLFMQETYKKELEAVAHNNNVSGVLTIGEIANAGESFLEIYNKTIVLGIW